jgi:hypothetical protein
VTEMELVIFFEQHHAHQANATHRTHTRSVCEKCNENDSAAPVEIDEQDHPGPAQA